MVREALSGWMIRRAGDGVDAPRSGADRGGQDRVQRSLAEAGRVSGVYGHVLHQRLNAYTGAVEEFGCPGNTVDNWRVHLSGREVSLRAANAPNGAKSRR